MSPASGPNVDPAAVNGLAQVDEKLRSLLASGEWDAERLRIAQRRLSDRQIALARESPFWRKRIGRADRLEEIAPLTREELREHRAAIRRPGSEPVIERRTSGSGGRPVVVEHGSATVGFTAAARLRQRSWYGLPTEEVAEAGIDLRADPDGPAIVRTGESPARFLINQWRLEPSEAETIHGVLRDAGGVRVLGGGSSAVAIWARTFRDAGVDARALGAELAVIGTDAISPAERTAIADVFGCRIAEWYGCREAPMIACTCPEGSLHVNEDRVAVEIIDDDGHPVPEGELGELAVTLLHNDPFPLLRYRTGDAVRAVGRGCGCGRALLRLDLEVIRVEELVLRRDGTRVHPHLFRTVYEALLGKRIAAFHTAQLAPGRFRVHLEIEGAEPPDLERRLSTEIERHLGEPAEIEVRREGAREAARAPSGKRRAFSGLNTRG